MVGLGFEKSLAFPVLHSTSWLLSTSDWTSRSWVGNEEWMHMFEDRLGAAGYKTFKLARTNNRGDGLLTAIHKDYYRVLNYRELLFNDCARCGDPSRTVVACSDTNDLWIQADFNGNGVLDYEEFKRIWNSAWSEHTD